ncbi:hypothetical protein Ddye_027260 [Dipteronia dyeriana]|uniref:Reverse transcriptase zinc-binding domain-containing protein n=1 Tax=Dipteronia dyeriana TaxID=168575 RepID=A0AAD9WRB1_9ROSI|nr:hypothetical protein Ddye_027260 [Dipteronia dyeriana]
MSVSDHNAIMLGEPRKNWGPYLFYFYNNWLEDDELIKQAKKGWIGCKATGCKVFVLACKVKSTKRNLKFFLLEKKKDSFSVKECEQRLAAVEVKAVRNGWTEALRKERIDILSNSIMKDLNKTFIALIPKKDNLETLSDFRPISLVGSKYKIIAKVLANRLKKVLNTVIGETQMAFVRTCQILDSFVIAEEIIHMGKRNHEDGVLVKLDFEKAYDSVDLNLIGSVNERHVIWGKMETLDKVLHHHSVTWTWKATELGLVRGAIFGDNTEHISHLQFADDTIIFLQPKPDYLRNAKRVLRCFKLVVGLRINFHKSCLVRIGDGRSVFWETSIDGNGKLREACPRFFALFIKKHGVFQEFESWNGSRWVWEVPLRTCLFDWEKDQCGVFLNLLDCICIRKSVCDALAWKYQSDGKFTVGSFHRKMLELQSNNTLVFTGGWQGVSPPKIELFGWQLLRGRLMVKNVMLKFGLDLTPIMLCSLCNTEGETMDHLFLHCHRSWKLWTSTMKWWGVETCSNKTL